MPLLSHDRPFSAATVLDVQHQTRLRLRTHGTRHTCRPRSPSQALAVCTAPKQLRQLGLFQFSIRPHSSWLFCLALSTSLALYYWHMRTLYTWPSAVHCHITDSVCSVYSAHEHSTLATIAGSLPVSPVHSYIVPTIDLPLDITLETLTAVLLLCVGIVIGSPELKPIQWRVWAGKLEKDKSAKTESINGDPLGPRGNPYAALEQRQGFLDIRSQRNEFADWVKSGSSKK